MTDVMNDPRAMPPSLWAATAPPPPTTAKLDGTVRADLCVVGAGYTGLSAALHAAQAGLSVVVLEAAEIGWGASGRNNGQVIPTLSRMDPDDIVANVGAKGEPMVAMIRDSASLVFDLIRTHGMAAEAVQNGWIQPAHRPSRLKLAEKRVRQWSARGAPAAMLINPLGYARGLAAAAIKAGAAIHTQSPAKSLTREGAHWAIATPGGKVLAERVVLATNAYSDDLWPGLKTEVVPVRSYQMATSPVSDNVRKTILPEGHALSDTQGDLYFYRFDANGRLVTGGALMIRAGWESRIRARIGERAARVYPQLGVPTFDYVWHGYVGVNQDRLPHIHELAPGVQAWTGCNGRGVALATAIGREFARAASGVAEKDLALPLSPVKPIAAHALAVKLAPAALGLYRWRDRQD